MVSWMLVALIPFGLGGCAGPAISAYNSNNWTASALQAAGAPTDPGSAVTSGEVMRQAAEIAARAPGQRAVAR